MALTTNPQWIEADGGTVLWSDGSSLNVTRGGITRSLVYRTTSRPSSLKTLELGVEAPARRRTF